MILVTISIKEEMEIIKNQLCITIILVSSFLMIIHATDAENITTTLRPAIQPKGSGLRCFKCNSFDNALCGISVYKYVALSHFEVVYCSDDCIKMVIEHDGRTDVIRGCSTGAKMDDHTCDENYCNHGISVSTAYSSLIVTIVYSLLV